MFQNVMQTESHNTQTVYSTVLYCTVQWAEQNYRHTVTAMKMFQTEMQSENQNTHSVYSTVLYCTVLSAEQKDGHTVTAS